jgi:hypothetical protein
MYTQLQKVNKIKIKIKVPDHPKIKIVRRVSLVLPLLEEQSVFLKS